MVLYFKGKKVLYTKSPMPPRFSPLSGSAENPWLESPKSTASTDSIETPSPSMDFPDKKYDVSLSLEVRRGRGTGIPNKRMSSGIGSLYAEVDLSEKSLASPTFSHGKEYPEFKEHSDEETLSDTSSDTVIITTNGVESSMERMSIDVKSKVNAAWIGTSEFSLASSIAIQERGNLECLINYRQYLVRSISLAPYDPSLYLELSSVHSKLGFTDVAVADAYKGLLLAEEAMNMSQNTCFQPLNLGSLTGESISRRLKLWRHCDTILWDEIQSIQCKAYLHILKGLIGCTAWWDGLSVAAAALENFPRNVDILEMRDNMKEGFLDRQNGLKKMATNEKDLVVLSRDGKIYQKRYPWMEPDLFIRTPGLVKAINKRHFRGNCEVRPAVFCPRSERCLVTEVTFERIQNKDVGPLGIFATRDIAENEKIMVDTSVTGTSEIPSSTLEHCDACHATLCPPYMHPAKIIKPDCCNSVAYCSRECYQTAKCGYHKVLCGKDFDWLYEDQGFKGKNGAGSRWRSILFLRIVAVVLGDFQKDKAFLDQHPLKHPLIARMAANYPRPRKIEPDMAHEWQYFENVVAPSKILMQLGINIFNNQKWAPEVIQTIYWRMENNANMAVMSLTPSGKKINRVNLNQNYLFFNHSCEPNVSWHGAVPDGNVSVDWLKGMNGEILKPGCSAVWCSAARDIKKGEELKISYIGDPLGKCLGDGEGEVEDRKTKRAWLKKWMEAGCGCAVCEEENRMVDTEEMKRASCLAGKM